MTERWVACRFCDQPAEHGSVCTECRHSTKTPATEARRLTRKPWATSTRRQRLPDDWPQRRQRVKDRADGRCEAAVHEPQCNGVGSQCDHVVPGDDHRLTNLQWLSDPCHLAKTLREAQAVRQARRNRKRPTQQPPGMITKTL